MKRFNFGLQKVLQLRKHIEEEKKTDLGRAVSALNILESRIEAAAQNRHRAASERFSNAADTGAILAWDNYITRLDQEAERLAAEAAQAELVVEEKRTLYLEASRDLKVIEKLREKRQKEYRKEIFAAETAERDDLWRAGSV
jgi:flagellar FliJ protein